MTGCESSTMKRIRKMYSLPKSQGTGLKESKSLLNTLWRVAFRVSMR